MAFMSNDLSETFSAILYNISDYEKQLTNISDVFSSTVSEIDRQFFISIDFLEYYRNYPLYPTDYKVIHNLNNYNLITIYNTVRNDAKYLVHAIETPNILNLKTQVDKIPNVQIKRDYNLQTIFFTSISKELFERNIFNGFLIDKTRRSYLFKTFGYYIPQEMRNTSLIYLYTLYALILKNLRYCLKIFESTFTSKSYALKKNTIYTNAFNNYIDNRKQTITQCLLKYIFEYTYKISNPSDTFLSPLTFKVMDKLEDLKTIFYNTMKIKDSVTNNLVLYGSEILYNYIACNFTNSAADPELNLVNSELVNDLKKLELDYYSKVNEKHSIQTFREYLYLVYYYKLFPRKFLNVLQLAIINYVKQHLVDLDESIFNYSTLQSYFYKLLGTLNTPVRNGINFQNLQDLLTTVITPDYLVEIIEQQRVAEFSTRISMIGYFEEIFSLENPEFNTFIDELYELIFTFLKETVQVEPYYEFYFNKKMVFWYLLSFLKRDILQNRIFMNEEIQLSELFYDIVKNPDYKINFNIEKMRSRTVQYIEGNINNIGNLFDNIVETAAEKKLHSENIAYFFS